MVLEEGVLHLALEGDRGLVPELDAPQVVAQHAPPSAVQPRPGGQSVLSARILGFDRPVNRHRAVEVLGVEPSRDVQDGVTDAAQVRERVLVLPVVVVGVVLHEVVPGRDFSMEIQVVDVGSRARLEEEVVAGVGSIVEGRSPGIGGAVASTRVSGEPGEGVHDPEGAVVVPVVADEHVRGGRLRGRGRERRVRVDHAHHRLPARVGDAPLPDPAVVALHVGEHPLDGVVVVGALVGGGGSLRRGRQRPDHLEVALGHELSAHVLEDEDVAGAVEFGGGAEGIAVCVIVVRPDRIGRAEEHHRERFGDLARPVDHGEELDAVPHGHHVRRLLVISLQPPEVGGVAPVRDFPGAVREVCAGRTPVRGSAAASPKHREQHEGGHPHAPPSHRSAPSPLPSPHACSRVDWLLANTFRANVFPHSGVSGPARAGRSRNLILIPAYFGDRNTARWAGQTTLCAGSDRRRHRIPP